MLRFGTALGRRVVIALIVSGAIFLALFLVPRSMPGELPARELHVPTAGVCGQCPLGERITGLGVLTVNDASFVNVRFAAPPTTASLRIEIQGRSGGIDVERTRQGWRHRGTTGEIRLDGVAERGNLAIFTLPPLDPSGIAVSSAGNRFPVNGYLTPASPKPRAFNAIDLVILLLLGMAAYFGSRRGTAGEVADLLIVASSFLLAVLLFRPVASLFTAIGVGSAAAAVLGGALILVTGVTAGFLLAPRLGNMLANATKHLHTTPNRIIGGGIAAMRQLPMHAILLLLLADVLLLAWIAPAIRSSLIGGQLLSGIGALFH